MHKYLLILSFVFASYAANSQILINTSLDHDTCLNKRFSIVFYIVLDSSYSVRLATTPTLTAIIDTLNKTFKRICVSFANCSTVFIPNYPYSKWKKLTTDPVVTSNWYTDKTINFYIVDTVSDTPPMEVGYAYPPPNAGDTPKDVIVMQMRNGPQIDFAHMFHIVGHFFGLADTWAELAPTTPQPPPPVGPVGQVVTYEYADGSNNTIHGDQISDTEADPGPVAQEFDGKGDPYIRPTDNYMSWFILGCKYTQQQYSLMAHNILTKRLYLH